MSQSHITNGYLYGFTGLYQVIDIYTSRLTKKKKKKKPITPLLKLQDYHKCVNYLVFAAKQTQ